MTWSKSCLREQEAFGRRLIYCIRKCEQCLNVESGIWNPPPLDSAILWGCCLVSQGGELQLGHFLLSRDLVYLVDASDVPYDAAGIQLVFELFGAGIVMAIVQFLIDPVPKCHGGTSRVGLTPSRISGVQVGLETGSHGRGSGADLR